MKVSNVCAMVQWHLCIHVFKSTLVLHSNYLRSVEKKKSTQHCISVKRGSRGSKISRPAMGAIQPLLQWVPGFFPGGKVLVGGEDNHSLSSSGAVLLFPLYAFMAWMGKTLPIQIFICLTFLFCPVNIRN